MRRSRWISGLGTMLLMVAAGCEDPITVTLSTGASPSPSPAASKVPTGSPSPVGSNAPVGSPSPLSPTTPRGSLLPSTLGGPVLPTVTPSPTPSVSPSPRPSVAPSPSGSPPQDTPAELAFEAPTTNADFTKTSVEIRLRATFPSNIAIREMALFYDGVELTRQLNSDDALVISDWNPHMVNSVGKTNTTQVPFGSHTLRGQVITKAGVVTQLELKFTKPFVMRGWLNELDKQGTAVALPSLPTARSYISAVGVEKRLLAFFGEQIANVTWDRLDMLHLDVFSPAWAARDKAGLVWRKRAGAVTVNELAYLVGGQVQIPPNNSLVTTADVAILDTFLNRTLEAPDLPVPLSDVSVAVAGRYLYALGGTTNGTDGGAVASLYRLELKLDGTPTGNPWEARASLPDAIARRGASFVATLDGKLYALGGATKNGTHTELVQMYDPATNLWSREGLLPRGVSHAGSAFLGGDVWLFGGNLDQGKVSQDTVKFNLKTRIAETFVGDANLPTARGGVASAVVNGQLFLVGGHKMASDGSEEPINEVLRANAF